MTKQQIDMISALKQNYSNITKACEIVGISRGTHYLWLDDNEQYKKECEDVKEGLLDRAETILHEGMFETPAYTLFFLKTKGKDRGYVEKQEIEHSGDIGSSFNLTVKAPKKK